MVFARTRQGAVAIVGGDSPVNADHLEAVEEHLQACLQGGQPRVVLDLMGVPLIDSRGLELILDYRDRYARCGGSLKLAAPNALVRDILGVTGVGEAFEIHGDVLLAVGSFVQ